MQITGSGWGQTPEEARANALQDLENQKLAYSMGGFFAAAFVGTIMMAITIFFQVLIRPLATVLLLIIINVIISVFSPVVVWMMNSMNPFLAAFIYFTAVVSLFSAMPLVPPIITIACATVEFYERAILVKMPDVIRVPVSVISAFVPLLYLAYMITTYDWTTVFSFLPPSSPDAHELWWGSYIFLLTFVIMQFVSIGRRMEMGERMGDFNWYGKLIDIDANTLRDLDYD